MTDKDTIHNAVQQLMGVNGFELTAASVDMRDRAEKIVLKFIKAERRAMVRDVKKLPRFTHTEHTGMILAHVGAWVFMDDILKDLAERGEK